MTTWHIVAVVMTIAHAASLLIPCVAQELPFAAKESAEFVLHIKVSRREMLSGEPLLVTISATNKSGRHVTTDRGFLDRLQFFVSLEKEDFQASSVQNKSLRLGGIAQGDSPAWPFPEDYPALTWPKDYERVWDEIFVADIGDITLEKEVRIKAYANFAFGASREQQWVMSNEVVINVVPLEKREDMESLAVLRSGNGILFVSPFHASRIDGAKEHIDHIATQLAKPGGGRLGDWGRTMLLAHLPLKSVIGVIKPTNAQEEIVCQACALFSLMATENQDLRMRSSCRMLMVLSHLNKEHVSILSVVLSDLRSSNGSLPDTSIMWCSGIGRDQVYRRLLLAEMSTALPQEEWRSQKVTIVVERNTTMGDVIDQFSHNTGKKIEASDKYRRQVTGLAEGKYEYVLHDFASRQITSGGFWIPVDGGYLCRFKPRMPLKTLRLADDLVE